RGGAYSAAPPAATSPSRPTASRDARRDRSTLLEALQDSWLAHTIGESQMLTASLSALHLVGFTLVMGSALVSGLRMLGVALREGTAINGVRPATRAQLIVLSISSFTGSLLFIPRAAGAAANDIFRLKLTLLLVALL